MRFGELKKMLKPITNTALTNALKELEADDLIQRIQYNEMPLRVEYSLTLKGQDLLPVFYAIMQWGIKYIPLITPVTFSSVFAFLLHQMGKVGCSHNKDPLSEPDHLITL